jgi:hypothetical protein
MAELEERLRGIDRLSPPDLWNVARSKAEREVTVGTSGRPPRLSPPRRVGTIVVALVIASLGLAAVLRSGLTSQEKGPTSPVPRPCTWVVSHAPSLTAGGRFDQLVAVSAAAPNDVWAVGSASAGTEGVTTVPLVEHFDGHSWRLQHVERVGRSTWLEGVAAITPNDVWVVGFSLDPQRPVAEHWDGSRWTVVPTPAPSGVASSFLGVYARTPADIWAVGNTGVGANGTTLVEHWDGSSWSIVPSPNAEPNDFRSSPDNSLNAVAAISSDAAIAVGTTRDGGSVYAADPLVERWDGSTWSISMFPSGDRWTFLNGVAADASGEAWVVGSEGIKNSTARPLIEHWDGSSWQRATLPGDPTGRLFGVSLGTAGQVWAVGADANSGQPLIGLWNGDAWTTADLPRVSGILFGVTADVAGGVWAVGDIPSQKGGEGPLIMRCSP